MCEHRLKRFDAFLDELWNVFENPLSIITGGPGTGKSFITKIIYEAAENAGLLCMAAAPTG